MMKAAEGRRVYLNCYYTTVLRLVHRGAIPAFRLAAGVVGVPKSNSDRAERGTMRG